MGNRQKYLKRATLILVVLAAFALWIWLMGGTALGAANPGGKGSSLPWWAWVIILFVLTFVLGIVAVLGGVGGGVLFVPIVSGFFPFHLDFVRCAGLLVALSGALSAGPGHLRAGRADLRLALPTALIASTASIAGAMVGLALPTHVVQTALGVTILGIVLTDLLIGIALGMVVGVMEILWNNYKTPYHFDPAEHVKGESIKIQLSEDVTFLNKAGIMNTLYHIPNGCRVTIDASKTKTIHPDILELIYDFQQNAKTHDIQLELIGLNQNGTKNPVRNLSDLLRSENR